MVWILPKIEMVLLLKWTRLILCFNFIYADVTQQPQAAALLQQSCETVSDLKLCPIRVGEGNSQITAIGKNVAEGNTAAWNREGWCGLSHNVLRVDFGNKFDIRQIRVKSVTSRPQPQFVKLDYWDDEFGSGDWQRYIDMSGSDNIEALAKGTMLIPNKGFPISTDRVKITMVLPEGMKSSQKACMKFEIFYLEGPNKRGPEGITSNFFTQPAIGLNFGIFGITEPELRTWTQFPFIFKRSKNIRSVQLTWKIEAFETSERPMSGGIASEDAIEVEIVGRTDATMESQAKNEKSYSLNTFHITDIDFVQEQNTPNIDIMFRLKHTTRINGRKVLYRIFLQAVKFNTQNIGEEISYEYNGVIKKNPEVDLKLARIGPDFPMNSREAFLIQPMGSSQAYRTLSMRMRVEWTQDQYDNGNPPRSFTSEYARAFDIAASDFTNTITWKQLRTRNRQDTFWVGTFDKEISGPLAFYFPEGIQSVKISNMIGYRQMWNGNADDYTDVTVDTTPPTVEHGDTSDVTEESCTGVLCLDQQPTVAGVIVGIIGALIVVALVAAILIWRRRSESQAGYRHGTNVDRHPNRYSNGGGGGIYSPIHNPMNGHCQDQFRNNGGPNGIYSLPDITRNNATTMPANMLPTPHHQITPNQTPNIDRDHRHRPHIPPPQPPEHIYEPPVNFRENSPRLYGPCGTIRYAAPDALRGKKDPPKIDPEHIKVLEHLGSGEFGEVLLVEAPIHAFPEGTVHLDLPQGATQCLAALKRLKPDSTSETKKTFLEEAKLMYGLRHQNILPLLAVIEEIPALLSGYSEHGDLRQFLRRRLRCDATNPDDPGFISDSSLLDITIQISDAMQYLEQKRVVHRDLAARNCFVGRNLTVRVGDFGMSRNLYTNDYFKVTGNAVLPIRWSAWESIILGKFTTQSDVWSFGVTCFETFRLCRERPLESMTDEQVIHRMVSLYKERSSLTIIPWLPKPDICPEGVWEIIEKCWMRDADKRPTFKHLNQLLNEERRQIENQTISSSVKI